MNRRTFFLTAAAFGLIGAPAPAQRFQPARFSVEVVGRGPDVILIPGLTAGREVWRGTTSAVPGYRYHLVHIAGFAGEPARGNHTGAILGPLADELARYIADRRLVRPAIVGHSMGGTLAMMLAARRPALVGKVMVVDMLPQPAGLFGGTARDFGPLAQMMGSRGGQQLFANLMGAFSPPTVARSDADVTGRAMRELAVTDLTGDLPRIRVPLTVAYASPDRQASAAIDRQFARAYSGARGARLVRIDGSGHMLMLDQPARFRAEMRAFLSH
jgi:N-formylmaleamate deformylase